MTNIFFWFYCLTITVINVVFVLLILFFNATTFFIHSTSKSTLAIGYFQSFMALWAYVLIPACTLLMWWAYSKSRYMLALLLSFIPIAAIFFTSQFFVSWQIVHPNH